MILALLIAGVLHAETVAVHVSAARQASVSNMQAMKRMKLSVYSISACAEGDLFVPAGRVLQALAIRGVPVEDPAFLPLILDRGSRTSTLGWLRTAGEVGGPAVAVVSTIAKADPWISGGAAAFSAILSLTKRRQDEVVSILMPLAGRLMKLEEKIPLPEGICYSGLAISSGDVPYAEASVLMTKPDAPIRVNSQGILSSWARPVDLEFTPQ